MAVHRMRWLAAAGMLVVATGAASGADQPPIAVAQPGVAVAVVEAEEQVESTTAAVEQTSEPAESAPPKPRTTLEPGEVAQAIADLDADQFDTRESATLRLKLAGSEIFDPLAAAAIAGGSLEQVQRIVEILRTAARDEEEAFSAAAVATLERLAASDNPDAARRARRALEAPAAEATVAAAGVVVVGGGVQLQAQAIQLQVVPAAGALANRRVETTDEQGRRIVVEENAQGIRVTITETVDGQAKTSEFKAANPEELAKQHPQAYELYKKHLGKRAPAVANIALQVAPAAVVPIAPAPAAAPDADAQQKLREQLKAAEEQLVATMERLKKLQTAAADEATQAELRESLQQLAKLRAQLEELAGQLAR